MVFEIFYYFGDFSANSSELIEIQQRCIKKLMTHEMHINSIFFKTKNFFFFCNMRGSATFIIYMHLIYNILCQIFEVLVSLSLNKHLIGHLRIYKNSQMLCTWLVYFLVLCYVWEFMEKLIVCPFLFKKFTSCD